METRKRAATALALLMFDSDSDSCDEDESYEDEDEVIILNMFEREKVSKMQEMVEICREYSNEHFRKHFRLDREMVYKLIEAFQQSPFYPANRAVNSKSRYMSAEKAILAFLWFAANKVSLRDVAQRFGIAHSTLLKYNEYIMDYLINIAPQVIKMPQNNEDEATKFEEMSGFPGVIGIIDGTYIPIQKPHHKIRSRYVNRHDKASLTLQIICDHQKKFIDVCTGIPGRTHDARVFALSDISRRLPTVCGRTYHLLGDSAYTLQNNLLTPYPYNENLTEAQRIYNSSLSQIRVFAELAIGLMKNVFQSLLLLDFDTVDKMTKFIITLCVLHNLRIDKEFEFEREGPIDLPELLLHIPQEELERQGTAKRLRITEELRIRREM